MQTDRPYKSLLAEELQPLIDDATTEFRSKLAAIREELHDTRSGVLAQALRAKVERYLKALSDAEAD